MRGKINSGNYLLIFVRNPELGTVKTRIARSVGDERALKIYKNLIEKTKSIAIDVKCFRVVYYSNFVDFNDLFDPTYFYKDQQVGEFLGERMSNAFISSFGEGAENVICIGSDCYDLATENIDVAFEKLKNNDMVIGPAADGGYYLIGMSKSFKPVFEDKEWGTSNVLLDTILDISKQGLSYSLLPTLNDVDTIEDLPKELKDRI